MTTRIRQAFNTATGKPIGYVIDEAVGGGYYITWQGLYSTTDRAAEQISRVLGRRAKGERNEEVY